MRSADPRARAGSPLRGGFQPGPERRLPREACVLTGSGPSRTNLADDSPARSWPAWLEPAATALLVLALTLNNLAWLERSQARFSFDFPVHALDALEFWRLAVDGDLAGMLKVSHYGPVGLLPAAALFTLMKPAMGLLNASQCLWLPVYAASLYYLGRRLYGRGAGFLACLYLFTLPLFASITKEYPLEVGSHALCVLAAALLVASDFLRWRVTSFWFGAVLALGAMTKPEFVGLWILPLALLFLRVLQQTSASTSQRVLAVGALVVVGVAAPYAYQALKAPLLALGSSQAFLVVVGLDLQALALLWAWTTRRRQPGSPLPNALVAASALLLTLIPFLCVRDLTGMFHERVHTALQGTLHGMAWFDPFYYLQTMALRSFHGLHFILLLVGLGVALLRRDSGNPGRELILGMLAWSFILVNAASGKFEIYLANLLGFASLVATGWAAPRRRAGLALAVLLSTWGVFTVFGWALPESLRPVPPMRHYVGAASAVAANGPNSPLPLLAEPPCPFRPVMESIMEDAYARTGGPFRLLFTEPDVGELQPLVFNTFACYSGLPVRVDAAPDGLFEWSAGPAGQGKALPTFLVNIRGWRNRVPKAVLPGRTAAHLESLGLEAGLVGTYESQPGGLVDLFRLRERQ